MVIWDRDASLEPLSELERLGRRMDRLLGRTHRSDLLDTFPPVFRRR